MKIGGSLARNARFDVSSRVSDFPLASPCLWGRLQNLSFLKLSKQVGMSFCVAAVARCDIPTCLIMCRKSFAWQAHYFCDVFRRWVAVFVVDVAGAAPWRPLRDQ